MTKITSFKEYNEFRRGKNRWQGVTFDMPRHGHIKCGLCSRSFIASDFLFLICQTCISGKVVFDRAQKFTDVVYGLYSMEDKLLYIGVTNNPLYRAHSHMLTKNFKTLKVIKYFNNRTEADDYEKWAIFQLRPSLNRLIDTDWNTKPELWDPEVFGALARIKKPARGKVQRVAKNNVKIVNCARCGQMVGKKRSLLDGKIVHEQDCSPAAVSQRFADATQQGRKQKKRNEQNKQDNKKQLTKLNKISKTCALCNKEVKTRNVVFIKDIHGNTGRLHKACYDIRVKNMAVKTI